MIGDPTRIRILGRLRRGPASVPELVGAAKTSQQNVSKHLTRLIEHGFVAREQRGKEHYYRLVDPVPLQVLDALSTDLAQQFRRLADLIGHND